MNLRVSNRLSPGDDQSQLRTLNSSLIDFFTNGFLNRFPICCIDADLIFPDAPFLSFDKLKGIKL